MRMLVTGTSGQVGWELKRSLAPLGELLTPGRAELDFGQPESVAAYVRRERPQVIVNPAAYTAVDKAESEVALAETINGHSVAALAKAAREIDALVLHYSTDYVFDGQQATPYAVDAPTAPVSAYGRSKLMGEQALQASSARHIVLRTAWVYAPRGKNFLLTMLRLPRERDALSVVADQFGSPTSARMIAEATALLLRGLPAGAAPPAARVHLTNSGVCSWHAFASAIVERGAALGLCKPVPVKAITTADYPTPAKRPANSALSLDVLETCYGICMPHWQQALQLCLEELVKS